MDIIDADISIQNPGQQRYDAEEEDWIGNEFDNGRRLSHSKSNQNLI